AEKLDPDSAALVLDLPRRTPAGGAKDRVDALRGLADDVAKRSVRQVRRNTGSMLRAGLTVKWLVDPLPPPHALAHRHTHLDQAKPLLHGQRKRERIGLAPLVRIHLSAEAQAEFRARNRDRLEPERLQHLMHV